MYRHTYNYLWFGTASVIIATDSVTEAVKSIKKAFTEVAPNQYACKCISTESEIERETDRQEQNSHIQSAIEEVAAATKADILSPGNF